MQEERTLIIIKPDAIKRNFLGEIIHRFERKGLRIVGIKMDELSNHVLEEHYAHHKEKPFFEELRKFMQASPVVLLVLVGPNAISAVRLIVGPTKGHEAPAGTIRGDFSISTAGNVVHASDSPETAEAEIARFFKPEELFSYRRVDESYVCGVAE